MAAPSPELLTVMSKPMSAPALTGPAGFAVLTIPTLAHRTLIDAGVALLFPATSLDAVADAVFGMTAQSWPLVGAVRVMVLLAPAAIDA